MRRSSQEARRSRFARDIVPKNMRQVAKQRSSRCADIHNQELHISLQSLFRPAQSTERREWRQPSGGVPRGLVRESRCYLFRGVTTERLLYRHTHIQHTYTQTLETLGNGTEASSPRSKSAFPDDKLLEDDSTSATPFPSRCAWRGRFRRADRTSGRERRSAAPFHPAYSARDDGARLSRVIVAEIATAE